MLSMIRVCPLHNTKKLGHVHTISFLILFLINIFFHHFVPVCPNCLLCLSLDDPKWRIAMQEEMKAFHKNKTWDLVKLPNEKKVVGCKWVFTIKH